MLAELQRATMGGSNVTSGSGSNKATAFDLYMLGLVITLGGMVQSWNDGLRGGIWEFFTSTVLMGIAYICLTLCMSEMTSALPFSGGLYGFVRVTISPFWGFVVAICEVIQTIFYVASIVIPLGEMITEGSQLPKSYEPVYWLVFFTISLTINMIGGRVFWRFVTLLACTSLLFLFIYIIGSFGVVNFDEYAISPPSSSSSASKGHGEDEPYTGITMLRNLPLSCWFFVGVEILPLAGSQTAVTRQEIPKAMIMTITTLIILSLSIIFTVVSQSPGIAGVDHMILPLNPGFARIFKIQENRASWLSIPHVFGSAFGFMFSYGRQLSAMAKSGMLPAIFKRKTAICFQNDYYHYQAETPYVALIAGSLLAIVIMLPVYYKYKSFLEDLFFWCTLGSFFIYLCAFLSFIELRRKYATIDRSFHNPLGLVSAIIGAGLFALNFISITAFQGSGRGLQHRIHPVAGFCVFIGLGIVWFFVYVQKNQCFSDEEQKVMFSAYVIKANVRGRRKLKGMANQQRAAMLSGGGGDNGSVHRGSGSVASVSQQSSTVRTVQLVSVSLRSFVSPAGTVTGTVTGNGALSVSAHSSSIGDIESGCCEGEREGEDDGDEGERDGANSVVVCEGERGGLVLISAGVSECLVMHGKHEEEGISGDYRRGGGIGGGDVGEMSVEDEKEGEREGQQGREGEGEEEDDLFVSANVRHKKVIKYQRPSSPSSPPHSLSPQEAEPDREKEREKMITDVASEKMVIHCLDQDPSPNSLTDISNNEEV